MMTKHDHASWPIGRQQPSQQLGLPAEDGCHPTRQTHTALIVFDLSRSSCLANRITGYGKYYRGIVCKSLAGSPCITFVERGCGVQNVQMQMLALLPAAHARCSAQVADVLLQSTANPAEQLYGAPYLPASRAHDLAEVQT
jgi:hypothetical protein